MRNTDVLVVGAGPAGIALSIYLKRAGTDFLLLEKGAPGGKLLEVASIENYPGFPRGSGVDLALLMNEQLSSLGIEPVPDELRTLERNEEGLYLAKGERDAYLARAAVIATGLTNAPSIPGEKEFLHKGVSYCATCDGPLYKGKDVAVIGHGERVLEEALYLAPLARKLYLFLDQHEEGSLLEGLRGRDNVTLLRGSPIRIEGEGSVSALLVQAEGEETRLPVSAVFPLSGTKSATAFLSPLPLRLEKGFIPVDENLMSELPGLFAIGDVRVARLRQAITAASDGALCSLSVRNYLRRAR